MKKKLTTIIVCTATVMSVAIFIGYRMYLNSQMTDLMRANLEALTNNEEQPPAWWDFFNNYIVEKIIDVSTSDCSKGYIVIDGITIGVSNCRQYSKAVVHFCYDGGNKNECTSTRVVSYI